MGRELTTREAILSQWTDIACVISVAVGLGRKSLRDWVLLRGTEGLFWRWVLDGPKDEMDLDLWRGEITFAAVVDRQARVIDRLAVRIYRETGAPILVSVDPAETISEWAASTAAIARGDESGEEE